MLPMTMCFCLLICVGLPFLPSMKKTALQLLKCADTNILFCYAAHLSSASMLSLSKCAETNRLTHWVGTTGEMALEAPFTMCDEKMAGALRDGDRRIGACHHYISGSAAATCCNSVAAALAFTKAAKKAAHEG